MKQGHLIKLDAKLAGVAMVPQKIAAQKLLVNFQVSESFFFLAKPSWSLNYFFCKVKNVSGLQGGGYSKTKHFKQILFIMKLNWNNFPER